MTTSNAFVWMGGGHDGSGTVVDMTKEKVPGVPYRWAPYRNVWHAFELTPQTVYDCKGQPHFTHKVQTTSVCNKVSRFKPGGKRRPSRQAPGRPLCPRCGEIVTRYVLENT
jgi:hypothetical protein